MTGTLLVSGRPAFTLFDSGASCSFISARFAHLCALSARKPVHVNIVLPSGQNLLSDRMFEQVSIMVNELDLPCDLLVLDLLDIDLILGIDWLTKYRARWDFHAEKISLRTQLGVRTSYYRQKEPPSVTVVVL